MNFNENIKDLNKINGKNVIIKEKCSFITVAKNLHKSYKSLDSVIENSKIIYVFYKF